MAVFEDDVIVDSNFGSVTNSTTTTELLSVLVNDNSGYRLKSANIAVTVAATGGGGAVVLQDTDGTVVYRIDANSVGHFPIDFGPGVDLTLNKGLQAVALDAGTNEATAFITVSAQRIHGV